MVMVEAAAAARISLHKLTIIIIIIIIKPWKLTKPDKLKNLKIFKNARFLHLLIKKSHN